MSRESAAAKRTSRTAAILPIAAPPVRPGPATSRAGPGHEVPRSSLPPGADGSAACGLDAELRGRRRPAGRHLRSSGPPPPSPPDVRREQSSEASSQAAASARAASGGPAMHRPAAVVSGRLDGRSARRRRPGPGRPGRSWATGAGPAPMPMPIHQLPPSTRRQSDDRIDDGFGSWSNSAWTSSPAVRSKGRTGPRRGLRASTRVEATAAGPGTPSARFRLDFVGLRSRRTCHAALLPCRPSRSPINRLMLILLNQL